MELNIREKRKSLKMSQEELASLAGVSRQTIINLENNASKNITVITLQKIAGALNCSVDDLLILPEASSTLDK
ncbi:MAG: helix-turn-helix transcriptional regulator [Erysipelotrichaceae bacterium]|nr:helix-turn-helix transcriptional regulator [Erysipelotrichaceae bacterium]